MDLDHIKIPVNKIGKNISKLYKTINSIKKSLVSKCNIKYNKTQISSKNQLSLNTILKYSYEHNLLGNTIKPEDKDTFKQILYSNNLDQLNTWISNNGTDMINRLNHLSNTNRIPKNPYIDPILINKFVEMNILDYLLNQIDYRHTYKIIYKNISINLVIYSKTKTISKKNLKPIIDRILILGLYKSKSSKIKLNIDIFMTPFKKQIHESTNIFGIREINSGFSAPNYKICIYRKEELNKVLVHELIHHLDLDLDKVDFDDFYNYFNIHPSTEINLNEAYTEIMAVILHSIILSNNITECKRLLNNELKFSLYQVAKILTFYGFDNVYDFFQSYTTFKYKQNTSVFSYFIVKTIILFNIDIFLDLLYKKKITKHSFKQLVISLINHKLLITINKFITFINKYQQHKDLYITLRMTSNG